MGRRTLALIETHLQNPLRTTNPAQKMILPSMVLSKKILSIGISADEQCPFFGRAVQAAVGVMCHEEVGGGGEFLEDLVRGGFEAGLAGGREGFGKCLHDRAEGDGEALHEVAGPDVAICRISNEFADDHWGFAMVGQGSEGGERKVWEHGAEGLRDFAIEVGVFGKETLIAE